MTTFAEAVAMIQPHVHSPMYSSMYLDGKGTGWRCRDCGKSVPGPDDGADGINERP